MAKTNVPEFLDELDCGIFKDKLATALSEVALGVLTHDKKGKVTVEFSLDKMDSDNPSVQIQHKLSYVKPTKRGKSAEEDTTATPMYVHKGGALCATPEKTETAVKESPSGLKALSRAAA
ncbi:hypothetical protein [Mannheimia pernigra]|uniref:Phage protein n=1 Tax=Mannheimia pernigra TaxID=111844 RepID=A0A7D5DXY4_9PAST|nr:hypothetical protein [Mannheimia pernigra]QLB40839.1 hypothetical protein HV559_08135 [Mannheimia pernigra]